jgi:hypothetical protein
MQGFGVIYSARRDVAHELNFQRKLHRMTLQRRWFFLALFAAAGCQKSAPSPTPAVSTAVSVKTTEPVPASTADPGRASEFAQKFFDAVQAGTGSPAQLTPDFKKMIAEATFTADLERGYSDDRADGWLKNYQGKMPLINPGPSGTTAGGSATAGTALRHGNGRVAILRFVPAANGAWTVGLLAVGPMEQPQKTSNAEAELTAVAFLAALLEKDDRVAEGLLTMEYKSQLAPPFGSDKRGYNRGLLEAKLAGFRGNATTFRNVTVKNAVVVAELVTPSGVRNIAVTTTTDGQRVAAVVVE